MKKVLTHWVSASTFEVPDECPTDNADDFERWIIDHDLTNEDAFLAKGQFVNNFETRDFEIVSVENIDEEQEAIKSIKQNYETDKVWNTEQLQVKNEFDKAVVNHNAKWKDKMTSDKLFDVKNKESDQAYT